MVKKTIKYKIERIHPIERNYLQYNRILANLNTFSKHCGEYGSTNA